MPKSKPSVFSVEVAASKILPIEKGTDREMPDPTSRNTNAQESTPSSGRAILINLQISFMPPGVLPEPEPSLLSLALKLTCFACAAFSDFAKPCSSFSSSPSCSSTSTMPFSLISSLYDLRCLAGFVPLDASASNRDVVNMRAGLGTPL